MGDGLPAAAADWLAAVTTGTGDEAAASLRLEPPELPDADFLAVLQLQSRRDPSLVVSAADLWAAPDAVVSRFGEEAETAMLLSLRRGSRVWPPASDLGALDVSKQVFDNGAMALASRLPGPTGLAGIPESVRPVSLAGVRMLPVLPALAGLLPGGGLRRGSTVAVAGSTSLALGLVAGPSAAGSWCAVVGLPSLGLLAAAELGVALDRLGLVAAPGADWAAVVAALLDALDVVVVRPPQRGVRPADTRRLGARARERGAVLVPLGHWDGADVRLSVAVPGSAWQGLGEGSGFLQGRVVEVVVEGRGAASRLRRARLWLPAADGTIGAVDAVSTTCAATAGPTDAATAPRADRTTA